MNNNNFSDDTKSWLDFAEYDLKTAKWEFEGKIYTSCCYSCQQAAEKSLKAFLLFKNQIVPKVHSLDRLITEIKKLEIETIYIEEEALLLDKYYISSRYPGQYGGPEGLYNEDDAKTALKSAKEILDFVKKQVG